MLTVSSSIFVGSLVLTLLYASSIYRPFSYATFISPSPLSKEMAISFKFGHLVPDGVLLQTIFLIDPAPVSPPGKDFAMDDELLLANFNRYKFILKDKINDIANINVCHNTVILSNKHTREFFTFASKPLPYAMFKSASSKEAITLFTDNFDWRTNDEYTYAYPQYLLRVSDGLLIYSQIEPRNFFSIFDIISKLPLLYTISFRELQSLQAAIFDIQDTFFAPIPLTGESWCMLGEFTPAVVGTVDVAKGKFPNLHLEWATSAGPSDTAGKAATAILTEKLISNMFEAALAKNDFRFNFSLCDGHTEYIAEAESGRLTDCKESILVFCSRSC
jgi:hypothetical protein